MSTENPILSNFDGLEGFEELASRLRLHVRVALAAEAEKLEPASSIRLPSHDFRKVGLELVCDWEESEVDAAAKLAHLNASEVAVVAVAEDGFLKERVTILGPRPAGQLESSIKLATYNGTRPMAMMNSERGFSLGVYLVLADGREPQPHQPHRRGTILASSMFQVRATRDTGGLDPKPLTAEKITDFGLAKNSVLFLDCDGEIVPLEHLEGQLDVYVSEALLSAASHHRGAERDAIIGGLAIEAMCQLVHVVSRELWEADPPDGDKSAVLRMLRRTLADVGIRLSTDEVIDLVRSDPLRVAGSLSGFDHRAQRLLSIVAGAEDETEDEMDETQ